MTLVSKEPTVTAFSKTIFKNRSMQADYLSQEFFGSIFTMPKQGAALTETGAHAHTSSPPHIRSEEEVAGFNR